MEGGLWGMSAHDRPRARRELPGSGALPREVARAEACGRTMPFSITENIVAKTVNASSGPESGGASVAVPANVPAAQ